MITIDVEEPKMKFWDVDEIKKKADDALIKAAKEIAPKVAKDLERIAREAVIEFYGSYGPRSYERRETLLNIFTAGYNGTSVYIDFDSSKTSGRNIGGDYIYDLVFKQGYHGGARYGIEKYPHPEPGIPYWKFRGNYHLWYKPAVRDTSPYQIYKMNKQLAQEKYTQMLIKTFYKYFK